MGDARPAPYEPTYSLSPYAARCAEIDEAALLLRDADAFAGAASEPELSRDTLGVCFNRPSKGFFEHGGCPFYQGQLLAGCGSNILCDAVHLQLHSYVRIKFCEEGRKAYCPIWRARQGNVSGLDTFPPGCLKELDETEETISLFDLMEAE